MTYKRRLNFFRMTSPDVGFYLKWDVDKNGLPQGCGVFGERNTEEAFRKVGFMGNSDCPKQDIKDGKRKPLWKRVEIYADNQEKWIKDFGISFLQMQTNGYNVTNDLVGGPDQFWRFPCCIKTMTTFSGSGNIKRLSNIKTVLECHAACQDLEACIEYGYNQKYQACFLFDKVIEIRDVRITNKHLMIGSKSCSDLDSCQDFLFE